MEAQAQTPQNQPAKSGFNLIKDYMNNDNVSKRFDQILGKKAQGFITSVMQIVSSSKDLSACDPVSIYNAAATAAILDLPLNNNLQFAALVPYKDYKKGGVQVAQCQIMWRGFVQLAQRSGKFSTINVTDVREGELISRDRMTGEVIFKWEQDDAIRQSKHIIGFVSYFRLTNGFEKPLYRTVAELKAHGQKYSKTWSRSDSKWVTDFEAMCAKTVIKENLNKWAPLSIEMAMAVQADQAVIMGEIDSPIYEYPDNPNEELTDEEADRIAAEEKAKQGAAAQTNLTDLLGKKEEKKK